MRKLLFREKGISQIIPDSSQIHSTARWARRIYNVQYFSFKDSVVAEGMDHFIKSGMPFDQICNEILDIETIPTREIVYGNENDPIIADAVFSVNQEKGSIVGPIKSLDGRYLVMKIQGWTTKVPLSLQDQQTQLEEVREKWMTDRAKLNYNRYVHQIMKGKKMVLVEDAFVGFSDVIKEHYMASHAEKKQEAQLTLWGQEPEEIYPDIKINTVYTPNMPFLKLNGEVWKLADIEKLIQSHPLVFRKKQISPEEFKQQLKFAIADLIRDHFLNEAAYEAGYDQHPAVLRDITMWQDSYLSTIISGQYLSENGFTRDKSHEYIKVINEYLNPYVNSLQKKYSDIIKINFTEFDKLQLTKIDMFAISQDDPYPVLVPDFPLLTTEHTLDYGKKLAN